jgi:hypothetical protein
MRLAGIALIPSSCYDQIAAALHTAWTSSQRARLRNARVHEGFWNLEFKPTGRCDVMFRKSNHYGWTETFGWENLRVKRARGDLRNAHSKENNEAKLGEEDLKGESAGYTGRNP